MRVEELRQLGKNKLVGMAAEKLERSGGFVGFAETVANFDRIKVRTGPSAVTVTFGMSIRYVPHNSAFYYSAFVDLGNSLISCSPIANPEGYTGGDTRSIYRPSPESDRALKAVLSTLKISRDTLPEDTRLTIFDRETFYEVLELTEYAENNFKIKKDSGVIFDEMHADLIHDEDELDEAYEEITE